MIWGKIVALLIFPILAFSASAQLVDPDLALKKLIEGNTRYLTEATIDQENLAQKREETLDGQAPFAVIVGCSDSRVPPNIIFDQSIGDLFVVRVAGNVIGPIELDSIEFSCDKLQVPLVVVLGHQNCGAVEAVISGNGEKDIAEIAPYIQKAVKETQDEPGDRVTNATKANVQNCVKNLKKSRIMTALLKAKKLKIVAAYYDLQSGQVEILPS